VIWPFDVTVARSFITLLYHQSKETGEMLVEAGKHLLLG
jgi:hypothetical protein